MAIYHAYFVRKWRNSLRTKQALYPEHFRLDEWFRLKKLRSQTDWPGSQHDRVPDLNAYLEGYSVAGDYLADLNTPTLIIYGRRRSHLSR